MQTIKDDHPSPTIQVKPTPKLFAWLASTMTVALIIATQYLPRGGDPYLRGTGVMVLLLSGIFIFSPFYLLARYGRAKEGQNYMLAERVVDSGLYAITRHPQYLGYMLLACGFALLSQHWGAFLLAILAASLFYIQAVQEERYCLARFGDPYAHYLLRVPRFNILLGIFRLLQGDK